MATIDVTRVASNLAPPDALADTVRPNRQLNHEQTKLANGRLLGNSKEGSLPSDASALESLAAYDETKAGIARMKKFVNSASKAPAIQEAKDAFGILDKVVGELSEANADKFRNPHGIDPQAVMVLLR